jgi:hypothetical protein
MICQGKEIFGLSVAANAENLVVQDLKYNVEQVGGG